MVFSTQQKKDLLGGLVSCLRSDSEIQQIIIFGSFLDSDQPRDLDVAIIQDSDHSYLPLAMKYRKQTRSISKTIPIDIVPIKLGVEGVFLSEIRKGKVIYEKGNGALA
jgi:predicted nucleotidyltransferase